MGNLDTLKVAAFVLKDLKNNERVYKTALVKVASKEIYEAKTGEPYMEKDAAETYAGWWLGEDSTANGGKNGKYDTYSALGKGLNWMGRFFGNSDSIATYANSSYMSNNPEARDKYLQGWGGARVFGGRVDNVQALRDKADAGKAEWSDRIGRAKAQQDADYVGASEKYMDTYDATIRDYQNKLQNRQDRLYNNAGLYGGPGGLGPNVGGPANHRPRVYGPYGAGWSGGMPIGRGMYGGGMYGRPYGSVYSRGGYGGYGGGMMYGGGMYRMPPYGGGPGYRQTWR